MAPSPSPRLSRPSSWSSWTWTVRRPFFRSPVAWWATTLLLALVTALVVGRMVARAEAELARLGSRRVVAVVVRPVPAGAVVTADAVARREVPAAFVPAAPVVLDPVGRRATVALLPGEVVVTAKLAPAGRSAVAALLPPGTRGVAVPRAAATPPVRPGDVVDVLATFVTGDATTDYEDRAPTVVVARRALVVAHDEDAVTVAVGSDEAARVAFAVGVGTVTLALAPARG